MNSAKYEDIRDKFSQIREWKYLGLYDSEIAQRLGVSPRTIQRWKLQHPEFHDLMSGADRYMCKLLKESIFKAAIGYEYTEESLEAIIKEGQERPKVKKQKLTRKWVRPDMMAAIFLLCNLDSSFKRTDSDIPANTKPVIIVDDLGGV
jgi:transcriptional regulator with XRE-family HTH domain